MAESPSTRDPTLTSSGICSKTTARSATCPHAGGGGVFASDSSPRIEGNEFRRNSALWAGGAIYCYFHAKPTIASNLIWANEATNGGGIAVRIDADPTITNNTIYGNTASGLGGGLYLYAADATFSNGILWGDAPTEVEGDPTINDSDVQGGWSGAGSNNFSADPVFFDPSSGDFHLLTTSPCRERGNNGAPGLPAEDFEGDPRILDGVADVGADEFSGAPWVIGVDPGRTRYETTVPVTIRGLHFLLGQQTRVFVDSTEASNVVVVDDQTITCEVPPLDLRGAVAVRVENDRGSGVLEEGFVYTPAILLDGTAALGETITLQFLCTPGDSMLVLYGPGPAQYIETPPFDGALCIFPYWTLFAIRSWPFDEFQVSYDVPDDPALVGIEALVQVLVGPSFRAPKDASWTNCLSIVFEE